MSECVHENKNTDTGSAQGGSNQFPVQHTMGWRLENAICNQFFQ